MMKFLKAILITIFLLALTGCFSSRSSSFYLLSAMEPNQSGRYGGLFPVITVYLKPVKFPEYLDRPQMVLREGDYKLLFSEYHRWAEPLKDNFTQVLIENLNQRIAPAKVIEFAKTVRAVPDYQLSIEVLRMDTMADQKVELKVNWTLLQKRDGAELRNFSNEFSVPMGGAGFESSVEAQSKAIALFSDRIAGELRNFR